MSLHPEVQAMLAASADEPLPYLMRPAAVRRWLEDMLIVPEVERFPVYGVEDRMVPTPEGGLPIRIYRASAQPDLPVLYFIHGGGWVVGSLDTHDDVCRRLTHYAGCITVSVGYRLAPEHRFPTPLQDVHLMAHWVANNAARLGGDPQRLAIAGDSAGGNLAAATTLLLRDRGGPRFSYQMLFYPVTDYYVPGTDSYKAFASGYGLDRDFMIWFWHHYLPPDVDLNNPYLCPLRVPDLVELPPAYVMTAAFDPLRDEGRAYALRLRDAGVKVEYEDYPGMVHGFLDKRQLTVGRQALEDLGKRLKGVFEGHQA